MDTWALVGVSAYFMKRSANHIAESNKLNREANNLAKAELKSRLKPELDFQGVKGSLQTSHGQYNMRVMGKIKNTGTIPASNINTPFTETTKEYLHDLVKEKDSLTTSKFFATLIPDTDADFLFDLPWAQDKAESKLVV